MKSALLTAALTACLCGCFSMESSVSCVTGDEHAVVSNAGCYLFNVIPLFCGNASPDENGQHAFPFVMFRDDVTMDKLQQRLMDRAAQTGRRAEDLAYHNYESVMITIPWTNFIIPIPYVLCTHEIQLSGVLRK